jgi:enoyl-CoA hydratase/carnithine racemase
MTGCSLPTARELFDTCSELMMAIHRLPQPVIAQVHGVATAAGCQLVAACDLAVASEDARFATPGVWIGLLCSTPMVEVSRAVGRKRALEMLLTGELIDARTAADGARQPVVPRALARRRSSSPVHTSASSHSRRRQGRVLRAARRAARAYSTQARSWRPTPSPDAREGIDAFLSKRAPRWRGREVTAILAQGGRRRECPTGRRRLRRRLLVTGRSAR